jgi:multidrug efflux pump
MLTATFLAIFMIPMFFVVIRGSFSGEKEDPDEALKHYNEHHPHDPLDGTPSGAQSDGSGKEGH